MVEPVGSGGACVQEGWTLSWDCVAGAAELAPVTTDPSSPSTAGANPRALESLSVQKQKDKSAQTEELDGSELGLERGSQLDPA